MFQLSVLRLLIAPVLLVVFPATAIPTSSEKVRLVCSGSAPVGNIVSSSGAYYAVSDKAQNASGKCSCDPSTSRLDCQVAPTFPVSVPQGEAVCQPEGKMTCAVPNIFLCQEGKVVGALNPDGAFYVPGHPGKPSGFCQCDVKGKESLLRCPDYPRSPAFKHLPQKHINCSKEPDCSGL